MEDLKAQIRALDDKVESHSRQDTLAFGYINKSLDRLESMTGTKKITLGNVLSIVTSAIGAAFVLGTLWVSFDHRLTIIETNGDPKILDRKITDLQNDVQEQIARSNQARARNVDDKLDALTQRIEGEILANRQQRMEQLQQLRESLIKLCKQFSNNGAWCSQL